MEVSFSIKATFIIHFYFIYILFIFLIEISQRFASVCDIDSFKRDRFPENTLKKVKWILKTFYQWHNEWKTRLDGVNKVFKTLPEMSVNEQNYCFQFFFRRGS